VVKKASEMTDEDLEARIRESDSQFRPLIDLMPVEARKPPSFAK
jgi:hypothetical protein